MCFDQLGGITIQDAAASCPNGLKCDDISELSHAGVQPLKCFPVDSGVVSRPTLSGTGRATPIAVVRYFVWRPAIIPAYASRKPSHCVYCSHANYHFAFTTTERTLPLTTLRRLPVTLPLRPYYLAARGSYTGASHISGAMLLPVVPNKKPRLLARVLMCFSVQTRSYALRSRA